ncbi:hypothetical protein AMJ85_12025 [candidate division BRC1 bacterium SM23_51]|nr:MAG: hypothetical protein AMJ85_12025 [candidate division BRC1 bacterium SM23_51]
MIRVKNIIMVGAFDAQRRGAPKIIKGAMFEIAKLWHRVMRPRHFKPGAEAQYHYKPRSEKYLARKQSKKRHQRPLVWSGKTRQQSSALYTITGTSRRVRGRMSLPWYVKMKPLRHNAPALGEELTRVTTREHRDLVTHLDKNVTRALNGLKTRKVVKV